MTNADLATQMEILARDLRAIGDTVERCIRDHAQDGPAAQRFDRTGSSGSDTSDPTAQAAMRGRPVGMGRDNAQAWDRSTKAIGDHVAILGKLIRDHHPDSRKRPKLWKACQLGRWHYQDDDGTKCICGEVWPCIEGIGDAKFVACDGRVNPETDRCTACRGKAGWWTCQVCNHGAGDHPPLPRPRTLPDTVITACEKHYREHLAKLKGEGEAA